MPRKTPIDIDTRQFELSHSKSPRGYGLWAFDIVDDSARETVATVFTPQSMNYSDAKVWIKSYIRANYAAELATGFLYLSVAP